MKNTSWQRGCHPVLKKETGFFFYYKISATIDLMQNELISNIYKVLGLGGVAFFLGVVMTPILTHYLYKYKMWRKDARTTAPDGAGTPIFNSLHKEREVRAPRMGGILIWGTTLIVALIFLSIWGVIAFVWYRAQVTVTDEQVSLATQRTEQPER